MKVCIPTEDNAGLTARISPHFGSAPWFTFVDTESGNTRSVPNLEHEHQPGTCDAAGSIAGMDVEAVVCGGFGRRAFRSMRETGIPVYVTESPSVGDAVEAFRRDLLVQLLEEDACSGGHGRGRHHHHH